jgi:hypothetical protein
MGQPLNKEIAAHLWQYIQVSTRNHRLHAKQHKGNVLFVGYADITLIIAGVEFLSLPGTSIKLMGDQIHFDPKQEKARDGSNRYFPLWLPVSAEARAVLTEQIKADPGIVEMAEQAVAKVTHVAAPATTGSPNPFEG